MADADLLVHVVDASDPDREQQIRAVEGILDDLGLAEKPRILVWNKADRLEATDAEHLAQHGGGFVVSALDRATFGPLLLASSARCGSRARTRRRARSTRAVEARHQAPECRMPGEQHDVHVAMSIGSGSSNKLVHGPSRAGATSRHAAAGLAQPPVAMGIVAHPRTTKASDRG